MNLWMMINLYVDSRQDLCACGTYYTNTIGTEQGGVCESLPMHV